MPKAKRSPKRRTCKGCGAPEKVNPIGYSNITPYSGYCVDCINRAFEAIRKEEELR
jgi:hypothetical protein